jgi:hypothetical protein
MILQKPVLVFSVAALLSSTALQPAVAAPWVRGFVVSSYEYAFRYGGRASYSRGGEIEPGVDCPHGSTQAFANEQETRRALSLQPWRSTKEVNYIVFPPGSDDTPGPSLLRFQILVRAAAYRGYKHGIETYINPFAANDPGEPEVTSRIGEGFNLDGQVKAGDFVSPDGEKGIDNALYRAMGCDAPWRGNGNANLFLRANDKMQGGLYTMVIRVTGNQDPMNDSDATVEIGYSPDHIIKDARGDVAADYSYRMLKSGTYSVLKASIKNGVLETRPVADLHAPPLAWVYNQLGDADFHQGRLRLNIAPGDSGSGLLGGYRNWMDLYAEDTFAQDGGQQGVREHEDHLGLYFALKRNADAMPDPKTGQNMGISTAYRIKVAQAYVVDPDKPMNLPKLPNEERRKQAYEKARTAMITSSLTRVAQPVPAGTGEADFPNMERAIRQLPKDVRDYLAQTLDRPYFPEGAVDNQGNPVDAEGNPIGPPKRQRQVSNDVSAGETQ